MFNCNRVVQLCALCRVISGSTNRILTILVLNRSLRVALSGGLICEKTLCSNGIECSMFSILFVCVVLGVSFVAKAGVYKELLYLCQ